MARFLQQRGGAAGAAATTAASAGAAAAKPGAPVFNSAQDQVARYLVQKKAGGAGGGTVAVAPSPGSAGSAGSAGGAAAVSTHKAPLSGTPVILPAGGKFALLAEFVEDALRTPVQTKDSATDVSYQADSKTTITGALPVLSLLAGSTPYAGSSAEQRSQILQWGLYAAQAPAKQLPKEERPKIAAFLNFLSTHLISSNFLAGDSLTVADVLLCSIAADLRDTLTIQQRFALGPLERWLDLVQRQPWRGAQRSVAPLPLNAFHIH